jgi:hypothetical protein
MRWQTAGGSSSQALGRMRGAGFTVPPKAEVAVSSPFTAHRAYLRIMRGTLGDASMTAPIEPTRIEATMKTYEFDVILKDATEVSDDQADALFEAGCDDGTPTSCDGLAWIHFEREAPSLEDAVRLAVAQVRSARLSVAKVELDVSSVVFQQS